MMSPFLDMSKFKDEELDQKIAELTKRLHIAQRMNSQSRQQLLTMLQSFQEERSTRQLKKKSEENSGYKSGVAVTTDENNQNDKEDDDSDLINIQ